MKTELEKFENWEQTLAPRLILGIWHPGFVAPAQAHLPFLPRYAICMSIPSIRKYFFDSCQGFSVWFPPLLSAEGAAFRAECRKKAKRLVVWTVNHSQEMEECLSWGDDVLEAIITDHPDIVLDLAKKVSRVLRTRPLLCVSSLTCLNDIDQARSCSCFVIALLEDALPLVVTYVLFLPTLS